MFFVECFNCKVGKKKKKKRWIIKEKRERGERQKTQREIERKKERESLREWGTWKEKNKN